MPPSGVLIGPVVPAPRESVEHRPDLQRGHGRQHIPAQRDKRKRDPRGRRSGQTDPNNPKLLIDFVEDLAKSGWVSAVENQLADRLNDELWNQLQSRRKPFALCHQLAELADHIENALKGVVCELTKTEMRAAGAGPFAADLAAELVVTSVRLPFDAQLGLLAKKIRVVGVFLCAITAQLDTCPCLRVLSAERTKAYLEVVLRSALAEPPAF